MNYCQRCLYPENHPLGITLNSQGICSGCAVHEEKDIIDWSIRRQKLKKILQAYQNRSGSNYDCVVPVSGARDSYYIVHLLKREFGLKPLLVTYNQHYNTPVGIRNLAYLRTLFDCDLLTMTVDPNAAKKVTRATLEMMGSIYWHCLSGSTVFPVQVAVRFKVPLIVWGAHQGIDQVGMFSHYDEVEMTRKYRKEHDLMGYEAEDIIGHHGVREEDVLQYLYPNNKQIESVGVRGIYLNNYIRWDTKAQHEQMITSYGYESDKQLRTFDTYNDVDSHHYSGLHDHIKYLKWGYGKVVDHACREIRFGRLSREQGIDLVKRYMYVKPTDTGLMLDWLGISEDDLWRSIDKHRDVRVWQQTVKGGWQLRDQIEDHVNDPGVELSRLPPQGDCHFQVTPPRQTGNVDNGYVLIGRGYVDDYAPPPGAGGEK